MARTTKSLAGQAAAAALRVISRRSSEEPTRAEEATATEAPVKKAPVKKAPVKKAPVKKAPVKKAPVKKATATKAPATKAPVKKAAAKKAPATKAPVKKSAVKKAPVKRVPAKKAPATKTPTATARKKAPVTTTPTSSSGAGALVVREGEQAWTQVELDEVLAELNDQRGHSLEILGDQEHELFGLLRDSGDGAGQDQADMGATSFERDHELTVLNNEHDKLAQIDRALARIADGSYGQCESCGQPIGKMRLMAFPRATLCMPCKQREERR